MTRESSQQEGTALRSESNFGEQLTPRKALLPKLQELVDSEDFGDVCTIHVQNPSSTPYRYIAYSSQIRIILQSALPYVSHTCTIAENFRSVGRSCLVRGVSAISWAYTAYDVVHEGHQAYLRNLDILAPPSKAYKDARYLTSSSVGKQNAIGNAPSSSTLALGNENTGWGDDDSDVDRLEPWPARYIPLADDYRVVMAKRAVFQGIASIVLPTFTIHRVVKYSGRFFKHSGTLLARPCMPVGLGLFTVPFLPYIFDGPVHDLVELGSRMAFVSFGGCIDI